VSHRLKPGRREPPLLGGRGEEAICWPVSRCARGVLNYHGRNLPVFTKILPYEYGVPILSRARLDETPLTFAAQLDRRALPRTGQTALPA